MRALVVHATYHHHHLLLRINAAHIKEHTYKVQQ